MEKTILNHVKVSDINYALISTTIKNIENFVADNGYQFKDRNGLDQITEKAFNAAFSNMSKRKRKKLAAYVWTITNRPSIGLVNKFFHFLMKNVLQSDARVRILPSSKEIAIQEKRKAYREALNKAKQAFAEYKTEKGDFYKIRLAKTQSI